MKRDAIDFHVIPEKQQAIHARLENWERWVRVRPHGWFTHLMWRNSRTSRQWEVSPYIGVPVNTIDAMLIEKAVSALPVKHRDALRWYYVRKGNNPVAMARQLALSKQGLADLVEAGRTMLNNRLQK